MLSHKVDKICQFQSELSTNTKIHNKNFVLQNISMDVSYSIVSFQLQVNNQLKTECLYANQLESWSFSNYCCRTPCQKRFLKSVKCQFLPDFQLPAINPNYNNSHSQQDTSTSIRATASRRTKSVEIRCSIIFTTARKSSNKDDICILLVAFQTFKYQIRSNFFTTIYRKL